MLQDLMNRLRGSTMLTGAVAQVARAFDIGQSGRRLAALPTATVALNTLIRTYGRTAIARSRYLTRNNGYAISARETFVAALVGYGIKPSILGETPEVKKQVQEDWLDWAAFADADGTSDFYGLQSVGAGELFEAGEFFLVEVTPRRRKDGIVPLKYRIIPSEQLPYENTYSMGRALPRGNYIQMGVEFNAEGERVAYHFLNHNPGDTTKLNPLWGTTRIPAEQVYHVFRPLQAGQVRGIPHTLAGMLDLAKIDLYDDAEIERKRVAALFAAFVTKASPEAADPMGTTVPTQTSGKDYEAFQYRNLLRAAAGMGVPYAAMTGDLKSANYGSIRAGLVEFRRRITSMQYHQLIFQMNRPVWARWLMLYTLHGLAPWDATDHNKNRRRRERAKWLTPRWEWVDPLKDLQAEKLAVDNGYKARWDVIETDGYDPEEVDQRIEDSQKSAEAHGLELNTGAASEEPPPDTGADPGDGNPPNPPQEKPDAS
jgi:capsid protein